MANIKELKHGGNIFEASEKYNIPVENWTDLSTGISPLTYPVPVVPQSVYARLPYEDPEFTSAVKQYYKSDLFLAVAGSQTAIEQLPVLLKKISTINKILVPKVGYQEHQYHLNKQGFSVNYYESFENQTAFEHITSTKHDSHILIIQPNNPTGMLFTSNQIKLILNNLHPDAFLIMDEAFIDASEQESCISLIDNQPRLIILRSVGKFFGLAGLRLGFVFAQKSILEQLENQIGKWQVSSPTQFIAKHALLDNAFHSSVINFIQNNQNQSLINFKDIQQKSISNYQSELFCSFLLSNNDAEYFYDHYANRGILLRLIKVDDNTALIRIGIEIYAHKTDNQ